MTTHIDSIEISSEEVELLSHSNKKVKLDSRKQLIVEEISLDLLKKSKVTNRVSVTRILL
jgi:hypothetical protein